MKMLAREQAGGPVVEAEGVGGDERLALGAVGEQGGVAQGDRERLATVREVGPGDPQPLPPRTPTRGCRPGQISASASTSPGCRPRRSRRASPPTDPGQRGRQLGSALAEGPEAFGDVVDAAARPRGCGPGPPGSRPTRDGRGNAPRSRPGQGPAQAVIPAAVALDPVRTTTTAPRTAPPRASVDVERVAVGGAIWVSARSRLSHSGSPGVVTVIRPAPRGSTVDPQARPLERRSPAAAAEGDVLDREVFGQDVAVV